MINDYVPMISLALAERAVGVLAAIAARLLMVGRASDARPLIIDSLVAPIVVVLRRGPALATRT